MIPKNAINAWRQQVPWNLDEQVEQDLSLSRAIADLYSDPFLQDHLAFRGDTALQKIHFPAPVRFSENLDFSLINPSPIDIILDHIKDMLSWLAIPTLKIADGKVTLYYKFVSATNEDTKLRIKIDINTQEHYQMLGVIQKNFSIENPWYTGNVNVSTYHLEELLGIKTRALFQRKKGRDLFDLYFTMRQLDPDFEKIIQTFNFYLEHSGLSISRANFEENLYKKVTSQSFINDVYALAPNDTGFEVIEAMKYVHQNLITLLPGEPWKGDLTTYLYSLTE